MHSAAIAQRQQGSNLPRCHYPPVIGTECDHGTIDPITDSLYSRSTGLLKSADRCCVMSTRSKLSMWIASGENTQDRYAHFVPEIRVCRLDLGRLMYMHRSSISQQRLLWLPKSIVKM